MKKTYNATIDYTPSDVRWPYRRLEYLAQPSGSGLAESRMPYINLSYYPTGWRWDIELVTPPSMVSSEDGVDNLIYSNYHFATLSSSTSREFAITRSNNGVWVGAITWGVGDKSFVNLGSGKHTLDINYNNDGKLKLDGSVKKSNFSLDSLSSISRGVFYYHNYRVDQPQGIREEKEYPTAPGIRLYGLHLQVGSSQVALIPAQRKSDGVVGLYNCNTNKFLTNSNTTEYTYDFVAGPTADECWDLTDPG